MVAQSRFTEDTQRTSAVDLLQAVAHLRWARCTMARVDGAALSSQRRRFVSQGRARTTSGTSSIKDSESSVTAAALRAR